MEEDGWCKFDRKHLDDLLHARNLEGQTDHQTLNMEPIDCQARTNRRRAFSMGKAYCESTLFTAASRIDALEREHEEMQIMVADHERRRHEAEAKACIAHRRAQDAATRYQISDRRKKDAEERARQLESQITDAMQLARESKLLTTEAEAEVSRFDKIRSVFDAQAFEERKMRVDAEQRVHEAIRKRTEAENRCLEESEKRVQAEACAKQEIQARMEEEMRNKTLRSKLREASERIKELEQQKGFHTDLEWRKKCEIERDYKQLLHQIHESLSEAEKRKVDAELKVAQLEQESSVAKSRAEKLEKKLQASMNKVSALRLLLDQRTSAKEVVHDIGSYSEVSNQRAASDLQVAESEGTSRTKRVDSQEGGKGRLPLITKLEAANAELEDNMMELQQKLDEEVKSKKCLQTKINELEEIITELKQNSIIDHNSNRKLQAIVKELEVTVGELKQRLYKGAQSNPQLEETIEGYKEAVADLKQRLEDEVNKKLQLQMANEELDETITELNKRLVDEYKSKVQLEVNVDDLEEKVRELKHRFEEEDNWKVQLHITIEELEDKLKEHEQSLVEEHRLQPHVQTTVEEVEDLIRELKQSTEQTEKQRKAGVKYPPEHRRLSESLIALRVEQNPLFRSDSSEPLIDDPSRTFPSRPESTTDGSRASPEERIEVVACVKQEDLFSVPVRISGSLQDHLQERPDPVTEHVKASKDANEFLDLQEKLFQTEASMKELEMSVQAERMEKQELELELGQAFECRNAAEKRAEAMRSELDLAVEREREYLLAATIQGKKERWGILDRLRSKIRPENL